MSLNLNQFNLTGFDSAQIEPQSFDNLPAGDYTVMISDMVQKAVKAPKVGSYLELTMEVVDGPHAGRKMWDRLNLDNPNETAKRIALETLSSIARAVGIFGPLNDLYVLADKPINVNVTYKAGRDANGNPRDEAKYRYSTAGGATQFTGGAQSAANTAAAAPAGKKPWEK